MGVSQLSPGLGWRGQGGPSPGIQETPPVTTRGWGERDGEPLAHALGEQTRACGDVSCLLSLPTHLHIYWTAHAREWFLNLNVTSSLNHYLIMSDYGGFRKRKRESIAQAFGGSARKHQYFISIHHIFLKLFILNSLENRISCEQLKDTDKQISTGAT